jgi:hypothetical protein
MIKKILFSITILLSLGSLAQEGTASPYSFYGIGDIRFRGTIENRLMGGLSFVADSTHINLQNPAGNASLKYTTFTVAGGFNTYQFKTAKPTEKAQRVTLDYLAVAMPLSKKAGFSFGLIPYSSVGYNIRNTSDTQILKYRGAGGVNKVFAGFGYKLTTKLQIGADVNYNFGTVTTQNINVKSGVQYATEEDNISNFKGLNINIGAMYQTKINPKIDFYTGITLSPQSVITASNQSILSSIVYSEATNPDIVQTLDTKNFVTKINLPTKIAIGAGIGQARKWMLGAEVTSQQSSNYGNRLGDYTNVTYENALKYSLGGYYVPQYTSFTNYFKKVTYRGGFRYENSGMVVNNESIKEQAFSLGFGLPLGGSFSNLNIGAEYGKRGTAKASLVQENFLNIKVSLSVNDLWFIKRKYD